MANEILSDGRSLEEVIPPEGTLTPEISSEISDLEKAHDLISLDPNPAVEAAKVTDNPTAKVETRLADFVSNAFEATQKDFDFSAKIQNEVLSRLSKMSDTQVLSLFGTNQVTTTDRISKIIGPTFQLMTAKQQNEYAEKNRLAAIMEKQGASPVQVNIGNVGPSPEATRSANEMASPEALQGFTIMSQLLEAIKSGNNNNSNNAQ